MPRYIAKHPTGTATDAAIASVPPMNRCDRDSRIPQSWPTESAITPDSASSPSECIGSKPVIHVAIGVHAAAEMAPRPSATRLVHARGAGCTGRGRSPDPRKASALYAPCPSMCSNAAGNAATAHWTIMKPICAIVDHASACFTRHWCQVTSMATAMESEPATDSRIHASGTRTISGAVRTSSSPPALMMPA